MQIVDTHSHLDTHHFRNDFHDVLQRSRNAGIIAQILPGVCRQWWPNLLQVCRQEKDLFAAPGLHPLYLDNHSPEDIEELEKCIESDNVVALGEIGLDYYHQNSDREAQQQLFESQLQLASKYQLPILLHVRKAHDQVQATIRRKSFSNGGIVHAFSGSLQQAEHYTRLGFKIGVGGTITYDRATRIRKVVSSLPLDALVLETDAPDIPPSPHNRQRNSPEYLPLVLDALAALRPEPQSTIAKTTTDNALQTLGLDEFFSR